MSRTTVHEQPSEESVCSTVCACGLAVSITLQNSGNSQTLKRSNRKSSRATPVLPPVRMKSDSDLNSRPTAKFVVPWLIHNL